MDTSKIDTFALQNLMDRFEQKFDQEKGRQLTVKLQAFGVPPTLADGEVRSEKKITYTYVIEQYFLKFNCLISL